MIDKTKLGAIIFIVGCVPFVRVGIIGNLDAKKMLQGLNEPAPNSA